MSKKILMQNFDQINTENIKLQDAINIALKSEECRDFSPKAGHVSVGLSSGTSGNRGLFATTDKEQAAWAGVILGRVLPKSLFSKQKVALFLRANNNLYESSKSRSIKFNFFDLLDSMEVHVKRLNEYGPDIIIGPPSMLRQIAEKVESKTIQISPIKIISAAEVLDPIDERYLSEIFGQKIHQIYQCTEGFLGTTCEYGTIHINEDFIFMEKEYLDKDSRKFIPIITDTMRTTEPIVRYRLNDILSELERPCPCGSLYLGLKCIEGRADDLFYFRSDSDSQLVPIFPDFIRRRVILASVDIEEFKVSQSSLDEMTIYLETKGNILDVENCVFDSFQTFFNSKKIKSPKIIFAPYEKHHGIKKMKRVERLFSI